MVRHTHEWYKMSDGFFYQCEVCGAKKSIYEIEGVWAKRLYPPRKRVPVPEWILSLGNMMYYYIHGWRQIAPGQWCCFHDKAFFTIRLQSWIRRKLARRSRRPWAVK